MIGPTAQQPREIQHGRPRLRVDHVGHARAQREPCLLRLGQVGEIADFALHEERLPADLFLTTIVVALKESDRISIKRERNVLLLLRLNLSVLDELVAPLVVDA